MPDSVKLLSVEKDKRASKIYRFAFSFLILQQLLLSVKTDTFTGLKCFPYLTAI